MPKEDSALSGSLASRDIETIPRRWDSPEASAGIFVMAASWGPVSGTSRFRTLPSCATNPGSIRTK